MNANKIDQNGNVLNVEYSKRCPVCNEVNVKHKNELWRGIGRCYKCDQKIIFIEGE